jgi:D-3-phosphoglycerate dehydrogenase
VECYEPQNEAEWIKKIKDVHVLVSPQVGNVTEKIIYSGEQLKMIQVFNVGYENVDVEAATKKGVLVCNVAEINAESVAEMTWALILALLRRIVEADGSMRTGEWRKTPYYSSDFMGIELWGKTLGVIGLGAIGTRVALIGHLAFNMKILVYDPFVPPERAQIVGGKMVNLRTLLKKSDVISIHCPLTKQTHHVIGEDELAIMKKSAILINTSRGAVIDEKSLIKCLKKGLIRGAGLDVYEEEPLSSDSPLRKLDNVILTPHIASMTEVVDKIFQEGTRNIIRFLKGQRPKRIVNPEVLKKWKRN